MMKSIQEMAHEFARRLGRPGRKELPAEKLTNELTRKPAQQQAEKDRGERRLVDQAGKANH